MNYQHIQFELDGDIATLTFNRPDRLNALHARLLDEVMDALDRIAAGGEARALILTGAGRAFCSGADLAPGAWEGGSVGGPGDAGLILETHLNPLMERLFALPVPIVAAVNGAAAGAGCSLALAADIVIGARSAYFLQAFAKIGLVPDAGSTWLLPRLIGRARALAMMLLAERVPAETAQQWGMIYEVTDDADLLPRARELAAQLAAGPTVALGLIRQGLRECLDVPFSEGLAIERRNQRTAGFTEDFPEGVAAFNEKRPPRYRGR